MPSGAFEITMIPLRFALLYCFSRFASAQDYQRACAFFLLCFSTIYSQYPPRGAFLFFAFWF